MRWSRPRASQRGTCTTNKVAASDKLSVDVATLPSLSLSPGRGRVVLVVVGSWIVFFLLEGMEEKPHPAIRRVCEVSDNTTAHEGVQQRRRTQADIGVDAGGRMGELTDNADDRGSPSLRRASDSPNPIMVWGCGRRKAGRVGRSGRWSLSRWSLSRWSRLASLTLVTVSSLVLVC